MERGAYTVYALLDFVAARLLPFLMIKTAFF
jgi:hypothetical protein